MVPSPPMKTRTPSAFQSIVARFPQDETNAGSRKTAGRSAASAVPTASPSSNALEGLEKSRPTCSWKPEVRAVANRRPAFFSHVQFLQIALEGPAVNAGEQTF